MWPFDYYKKKREKEEQMRERTEEQAKRHRLEEAKIAEERERRLEENRRKERDRLQRLKSEQQKVHQVNAIFSKSEMEELLQILSDISYIFQKSDRLRDGRNLKMMSRTHSYAGILGYFYEEEYHYGKMSCVVDAQIASHYQLVKANMLDSERKKQIVNELADNWSDVLQVIFNLELDSNFAGDKLKSIENDIQKVTSAFERLSGSKCRDPKNPLHVKPKVVTYNPFNITEDVNRISSALPDFTDVFARELIPQMVAAIEEKSSLKDVVANYALSMIKAYYDNAGYVPMLIVEQITGQINQVAEIIQRVSYAPQNSLREYVLSQIYK